MVSFFEEIVDFLNHEQIPYMLTGSMAMSIYALNRSTKDFDFLVELQQTDVEKMSSRFKDNYYCDKDSIKDAMRRGSLFNIIDHQTGFKADFITLRQDEFEQLKFSRRQQVDMFGRTVFVITVEDLILSKLIWIQQLQSAVQMFDIQTLAQYTVIDWSYIMHWAHKLNLNTFDLFPNDRHT